MVLKFKNLQNLAHLQLNKCNLQDPKSYQALIKLANTLGARDSYLKMEMGWYRAQSVSLIGSTVVFDKLPDFERC